MTVSLNRAYQGFAPGQVVDLDAATEAALIAQGIASSSSAAITPGNQSVTAVPAPWQPVMAGYAAIATASTNVVITVPGVTAQHKAWAAIAQSGADGTLTSIVRVLCGTGTVTITGNAAATAQVRVAYWVTT